ncbi:unnamed protein product [Brassica rapa]|uniref:Uncharacterized protein n=1 Tax=Brassica campestris TaxID=3711 RepID=A0A3P5ZMM1_BRACM|nr:unnamed protein product [Brassica rapa]VDC75763.1 unnamed protein product [Brassica rapa]
MEKSSDLDARYGLLFCRPESTLSGILQVPCCFIAEDPLANQILLCWRISFHYSGLWKLWLA